MLLLSCLWILIGAGIGALAIAAGWDCAGAGWSRRDAWLATLGIGIVTALIGGWLGSLIFDRYYTTPTALWVSVVGVVAAHNLIRWRRRIQIDI